MRRGSSEGSLLLHGHLSGWGVEPSAVDEQSGRDEATGGEQPPCPPIADGIREVTERGWSDDRAHDERKLTPGGRTTDLIGPDKRRHVRIVDSGIAEDKETEHRERDGRVPHTVRRSDDDEEHSTCDGLSDQYCADSDLWFTGEGVAQPPTNETSGAAEQLHECEHDTPEGDRGTDRLVHVEDGVSGRREQGRTEKEARGKERTVRTVV